MAREVTCPRCGARREWDGNPWRPFCSERCRMTDLGAWVLEWYRVPGLSLTTPAAFDEPDESSEGRSLQ